MNGKVRSHAQRRGSGWGQSKRCAMYEWKSQKSCPSPIICWPGLLMSDGTWLFKKSPSIMDDTSKQESSTEFIWPGDRECPSYGAELASKARAHQYFNRLSLWLTTTVYEVRPTIPVSLFNFPASFFKIVSFGAKLIQNEDRIPVDVWESRRHGWLLSGPRNHRPSQWMSTLLRIQSTERWKQKGENQALQLPSLPLQSRVIYYLHNDSEIVERLIVLYIKKPSKWTLYNFFIPWDLFLVFLNLNRVQSVQTKPLNCFVCQNYCLVGYSSSR